MDKDFFELLDDICLKPGIYVGSGSLFAVYLYLSGYAHAQRNEGKENNFNMMMRWTEYHFGISNAAWHWTRILRHFYTSDEECLSELPKLIRRFASDYSTLSGEELWHGALRKAKENGYRFGCPEEKEDCSSTNEFRTSPN